MENQAQTQESPPMPPDLTATIQALAPGSSHFFEGANPTSVRAIASRLGGKRKFKTQAEGGGVRVWRKNVDG